MSQMFRFSVPLAAGSSSRYDALVQEHMESLLLLGDFFYYETRCEPTAMAVIGTDAAMPAALFSDPNKHYWNPTTVTTTKVELHQIRKAGDVDAFYDIDVLRMTEPRILFIQRTLECINRLPDVRRTALLATFANIEINDEAPRNQETLRSAFRDHLSDLLTQVRLFSAKQTLSPNAFLFKKFPSTEEAFTLNTGASVEVFESFLRRFGKLIGIRIQAGKVVEFKLKDYEPWLGESSGEPFEILGVLSRDCNAKCDFCYVLGNPNNTAIKLQKFTAAQSGIEAEIRLKYFSQGKSLPIPTYDTEEIMTHPRFMQVCEDIRKSSSRCISITTNGYKLDESTLLRLKALGNIDISLSLNSHSPQTREWLMGGLHGRGLKALELLDKHRIPAALTLTAWPRVSISDIKETILHAARFNLRSISVLLGGFTKFFPDPPEYPIPEYWNFVIDAIHGLREEIPIPLIIQPRLYEEQYRFPDRLGASIVTGVSPGSAAAASDIKVYDEIVEIGGVPITTRNQCISMLATAANSDQDLDVRLLRSGSVILTTISVRAQTPEYIYGKPFEDKFGIHLIGENIRVSSIREIFDVAARHNAQKILFLTSMIVRPLLKSMLEQFSFLCQGDIEFDLQVVPNRFLGGNIVMGDMLVLDDFRDFLEQYLASATPDLIMLPSGPFNHGGWLRDMKGQPFELLRRTVGVPIHMIMAPYFE